VEEEIKRKEKYEENGGCKEGGRRNMVMMRRSKRKTAKGYRRGRIRRMRGRVGGRGGDKKTRRVTVLSSPHLCSSQIPVSTKADSFRIIWF
jgi:hypothetical protein